MAPAEGRYTTSTVTMTGKWSLNPAWLTFWAALPFWQAKAYRALADAMVNHRGQSEDVRAGRVDLVVALAVQQRPIDQDLIEQVAVVVEVERAIDKAVIALVVLNGNGSCSSRRGCRSALTVPVQRPRAHAWHSRCIAQTRPMVRHSGRPSQ